jgi:hypothetical protein
MGSISGYVSAQHIWPSSVVAGRGDHHSRESTSTAPEKLMRPLTQRLYKRPSSRLATDRGCGTCEVYPAKRPPALSRRVIHRGISPVHGGVA